MDVNPDSDRRTILHAAGTFALLTLLPASLDGAPLVGGDAGRFLTARELDTLRAVTARFIPGPPDDPDPGAVEAGVAEAIDLLLGAFTVAAPPIHAGGPFSDRAGVGRDDFADFVAMDAMAELGWRIRIEGSKGLAEREFAGPVVGFQQIYRDGLARLDAEARRRFGVDFAGAAGPDQDALLSEAGARAFVDTAFGHTLEAMYGPPEYGGNRGRAGWAYTRWDGDDQPKGYSDAQVSVAGEVSLCASPPSTRAMVEQVLGLLGARPTSPRGLWSDCPEAARR